MIKLDKIYEYLLFFFSFLNHDLPVQVMLVNTEVIEVCIKTEALQDISMTIYTKMYIHSAELFAFKGTLSFNAQLQSHHLHDWHKMKSTFHKVS